MNIWSIHVEQADGKSVVRASIGKKGAIKIICDQVNLQTASDFFQAQGKVIVSGENVQCRCEKLSINLNEDRLLLEGKAEIGILKHQSDAAEEAKAKPDDDKNDLAAKEEPKDENGPLEKVQPSRGSAPRSFLVELKAEQFSLRWPDMHIPKE